MKLKDHKKQKLEEFKKKYCNCNKLPTVSQLSYGCVYHHLGLEDDFNQALTEVCEVMRDSVRLEEKEEIKARLHTLRLMEHNDGFNQAVQEQEDKLNKFFE